MRFSAYTQIRKNNAIGKTSTSVKSPIKFNSYNPLCKSKLKQTRNIGYVVPPKCNFHSYKMLIHYITTVFTV